MDAWSERNWDPRKFGIPIDFGRPFFEQVSELIRKTPYQSLIGSSDNMTNNALYTNHTSELRNCYLISNANKVNDSCYCTDIKKSEYCMDCLACSEAQKNYECISCTRISECRWCQYVTHSSYCALSKFLKGCSSCMACVNLNHKKYHVLNKEITPEEFKITQSHYNTDESFRKDIQKKYAQLCAAAYYPATIQVNAMNSV